MYCLLKILKSLKSKEQSHFAVLMKNPWLVVCLFALFVWDHVVLITKWFQREVFIRFYNNVNKWFICTHNTRIRQLSSQEIYLYYRAEEYFFRISCLYQQRNANSIWGPLYFIRGSHHLKYCLQWSQPFKFNREGTRYKLLIKRGYIVPIYLYLNLFSSQ